MTNYLDGIKKEIDETDLSTVSKTVIKSTVNKIIKMIDTNPQLSKPKDLIKLINLFLKNNENLNTSHTFIAHIKSILKHTSLKDIISLEDQTEINNLFIKFKHLKERKDDSEEPSAKQIANYIPYEEIVSTFKERKDKLFWKDRLMYGLYVLQPPLRADYGDIKLILDSEEFVEDINQNYFLIDKSKMIINQYKSNKITTKDGEVKHKPLTFFVNDEVYDLIYDSIKVGVEDTGDMRTYVIQDRYGNPMTANTLSKNITRIGLQLFGKHIGIQELRTIFCSRFLLQDEDCSIETIIKDSKNMGHSISVHMKKYMKNYTKKQS
jgi:hypothetical protein